ncbi:hypothetical protein LK07_14715 [Streptomyces pluripotens]|uniref:Lipoprotein CseA n=1 Tax=Streptomyces pluripotens TaxID=1355015 RepID=A0A221NZW9_9ACTN|nr:hypothetical protein LK06_013575 [Streptomyces pluripotens]ASN25075.1 hypothetical protein LK07_14715 [Streptomyces pluripotens]KIE25498.1 lipoprotein CseA [Streptomyces sp. MUSC 125]MCH0557825.1 hypothetical protein [Streptomyces sp. MUM 16J]
MIAAVASITALALFAAACGTGGTGARDEGPAHASAVAGAVASPVPSPSGTYRRVDAVALLLRDPAVSESVKRGLKPCTGHEYPLDVSYGDLTGGPVDDVVINVLTCADAVGIGSYVYRDEKGTFENVFKTEESPVYADIEEGQLSVTRQFYEKGDPVSSPSGEIVTPYRWKGGRFVPGKSVRNEYSKSAGLGTVAPAEDN